MIPSKMQQLEAEADQRIRDQQTSQNGEQGTSTAEADADVTQVDQNTDAGVAAPISGTETPPDNSGEVNALKAELEKADRRYQTLDGMFRASEATNASLRVLMQQLSSQLEELRNAPAPASAPAPAVSDADRKNFGDDLIDLATRIATDIVDKRVGNVREQIGSEIGKVNSKVDTVAEATVQSNQERFNRDLATHIPNWQQINMDADFVKYLQDNDWLEPLNTAYSRQDLANTVKFFKRYEGHVASKSETPPPVRDPAAYVAPGKPKSVPAPTDSKGSKVWSTADIKSLYDRQLRKQISPEEFTALERDLFKAQAEGRVRG